MTPAILLWWLSILLAVTGGVIYLVGLVRRWRPGPDGRPAGASEPTRFQEPWSLVASALLLAAIMAQAVARLLVA